MQVLQRPPRSIVGHKSTASVEKPVTLSSVIVNRHEYYRPGHIDKLRGQRVPDRYVQTVAALHGTAARNSCFPVDALLTFEVFCRSRRA